METGLWVLAVLAAAGWAAGGLGRWLLSRLCRGTRIPPPWCELAVAILWTLAAAVTPPWWLAVPLALAWFAVLLTATDIACRRLPDALTLSAYPVVAAGLVGSASVGPDADLLQRSLVVAVVFLAVHAGVAVMAPAALGGGDVKLSGVVGAVLGAVSWSAAVLGVGVASAVTVVVAAVSRRRTAVPHGPGMLAAAWILSLAAPGFPAGP
ncbi:MAG: prepilin peptidase [Kutzneria sp.]|nr:prepilin peptidase [Kutzneria sp.]MBV9844768.1 prepilin peptidase [Kutzneria sp.]